MYIYRYVPEPNLHVCDTDLTRIQDKTVYSDKKVYIVGSFDKAS